MTTAGAGIAERLAGDRDVFRRNEPSAGGRFPALNRALQRDETPPRRPPRQTHRSLARVGSAGSIVAHRRLRGVRVVLTAPRNRARQSMIFSQERRMRFFQFGAPPAGAFRLAAALALFTPFQLRGQAGAVGGVVVSRGSGAPVSDAQVRVVGTTLLTLTDAAGRFRFSDVPGTTVVLAIRRIQFRAAQDTVNVGDLNVRIALEEKALELEGLVVTGTSAATAQREIGNAVSRIDAATVTQTAPINSFQDLVNGRAAGVLIQPATGAVGTGSRIRIRGASSFSLGNQPLVYVDGVRVDADFATGPQNQDFGSSSISRLDRKSTRLNSSHPSISYAVFCLKKKNDEGNDANHQQLWRLDVAHRPWLVLDSAWRFD